MSARAFTAPFSGAVAFNLDAAAAVVTVTVSAEAETALAEISGPAEIVDGARTSVAGDRWYLSLPRPEPVVIANGAVINSGGGTVVIGNSMVIGGISVSGGNMRIGSISGVTGVSIGTAAQVRVNVTLPAGSGLSASVESGRLDVLGALREALIVTTSADVETGEVGALTARTVSGRITAAAVRESADLHTISGRIRIADTAVAVTAKSVSGDITISARSAAYIMAKSVSGDITVTGLDGARPDVRARTVSGRVRTGGDQ